MFGKLLIVRKLNPFHQKKSQTPPSASKPNSKSALKLVHPGGRVEVFYMAMPAGKLMERYPAFVLAKPSVFKQPWDSVIQPNEIVFPGQKLLVVPWRTVKKLRSRIRKPDVGLDSFSSFSISSTAGVGLSTDKTVSKSKGGKKRVQIFGIDVKRICKKGSVEEKNEDRSLDFSTSIISGSVKSRTPKVVQMASWHPALESISEIY